MAPQLPKRLLERVGDLRVGKVVQQGLQGLRGSVFLLVLRTTVYFNNIWYPIRSSLRSERLVGWLIGSIDRSFDRSFVSSEKTEAFSIVCLSFDTD